MKVSYLCAALACLIAITFAGQTAQAGIFVTDGIVVKVTAEGTGSAAGETKTWQKFFPAAGIVGQYPWDLGAPVTLMSANNVQLGSIETLGVTFDEDPAVNLRFSVKAGQYGTNFTITSSTIGFDSAIANPIAYATCSVGVVDINQNGATLSGLMANGSAYQATFNGSTAWANLLTSPVVAPAFGTGNANDRRPASPAVWESVPYPVNMMSAQFKFSLSGSDTASGTSMFEVVPEPATLAFLALGGLFLARRRA